MEASSTLNKLSIYGTKPLATAAAPPTPSELVIPTRKYSFTKVCCGVRKAELNDSYTHKRSNQRPTCPRIVVVPEQKLKELTAKIVNSQMSRKRPTCIKILDALPQKDKENMKSSSAAKKVAKKANQQPKLMMKSIKMLATLRCTTR